MSTLKDLISQRDALEKKIVEICQVERTNAISQALAIISEYELTQQELFGGARGVQKARAVIKVAAKYRDTETGKEWSGRGLEPKWLNGKDKAQFLIVSTSH